MYILLYFFHEVITIIFYLQLLNLIHRFTAIPIIITIEVNSDIHLKKKLTVKKL